MPQTATESAPARAGSVSRSGPGFGWLPILVLALCAAVNLVNSWRMQNRILDDTYITLRFAQHLAQGQGLVWNIGGERVEGYSSSLHVFLLALLLHLGISPETACRAVAVAALAGAVAMMVWILRREFQALGTGAALVVGMYLLDPNTASLSAVALETHLFIFLLCATYAAGLYFLDRPSRAAAIATALAAFLAIACRPDGALYVAVSYAVMAIHAWSARDARRGFVLSAGVLAGLGIVYALAKYEYFGYLLPNPFYVKSNQVGLKGLSTVSKYVIHVAGWLAPILVGFIWFTPAGKLRLWSGDAKNRAKLALTLLPPVVALAYYTTITHEVGGSHRFSYPTYFYVVMAMAALVSFTERAQLPRRRFQRALPFLLCLPFLIGQNWRALKWPFVQEPPDGLQLYHDRIARTLQSTGLGARATVLCDAAGVIPFLSGFNQLDRVGLTENFLSGRRPVSPEERERYIWSRKPDVYLGYEAPAAPGATSPENDPRMRTRYVQRLLHRRLELVEDRIFQQKPPLLHARMRELRDNWQWIGEAAWPGWQYWGLKSFLYVRKDSAHRAVLAAALRQAVLREPSHIDLQ